MFDIGFSELFVIGIVALIVIGPERLPKVARTAGHLFGRMQRYVNDVKADINREMELDELRKMKTQFESAAREVETSVNTQVNAISAEVQAAQDDIAKQAALDDLTKQAATDPAAAGLPPAPPAEAPVAPSPAPAPETAPIGAPRIPPAS
jgi:sec-independent protein translocase protein TatB